MSDDTEVQYRVADGDGWTQNFADREMAEKVVTLWRKSGKFPDARVEQRVCGPWTRAD